MITAVTNERGMNPSRHPMHAKFQGPPRGSSPQRHRTWLKLSIQPSFTNNCCLSKKPHFDPVLLVVFLKKPDTFILTRTISLFRPPRMAATRLRKTFQYPSESDDEDAVEQGMDEQGTRILPFIPTTS